MPPLAIVGVGLAVGAAAGSIYASSKAAGAQKDIAQAQLDAQNQTRSLAMGAAAPTPQELDTMSSMIDNQTRQLHVEQAYLDQAMKLMSQINPAAAAAANNLTKLMNGGSAPMLQPIQQQRDLQRQQLQQQLEQAMGPGYATSTAGQQALQQFDMQTNYMMTQAQQQGVQTAEGAMTSGVGAIDNLSQGVNNAGITMGNLYDRTASFQDSIQKRQIAAITGTNTAPYAGAQFVGDLQSARGAQQGFGQMATLGSMMAGGAMGGGAGAGAAGAGAGGTTAWAPPAGSYYTPLMNTPSAGGPGSMGDLYARTA